MVYHLITNLGWSSKQPPEEWWANIPPNSKVLCCWFHAICLALNPRKRRKEPVGDLRRKINNESEVGKKKMVILSFALKHNQCTLGMILSSKFHVFSFWTSQRLMAVPRFDSQRNIHAGIPWKKQDAWYLIRESAILTLKGFNITWTTIQGFPK